MQSSSRAYPVLTNFINAATHHCDASPYANTYRICEFPEDVLSTAPTRQQTYKTAADPWWTYYPFSHCVASFGGGVSLSPRVK